MPLDRAWTVLGRNPRAVAAGVAALPRERRLEAIKAALEEAKKLARALMVKHHPDRGGDPALFREVGEALASVEAHTLEAERVSAEKAKEAEARALKRGPLIKIG